MLASQKKVIKASNKVVFRNKLKEYRENKGLSQTEMAARLGVTVPYLRVLESRGHMPRGEARTHMLHVLDADFNDLFYEVL